MLTNTLFWTFFVFAVSAQNDLPRAGPLKPGVGDTPEALKISEEAGRQPNASSSVTFKRTYDNKEESWTWKVNISDISIPDRLSDLGSPSANFSEARRVANTQWQLQWPGDENNIKSFLEKRNNMTISFHTLITNRPSNITDRYDEKDGGNCGKVLGDQCTKSLTEAASKDSFSGFSNLEGCKDSLNTNGGDQDGGAGFDVTSKSNLSRTDTLFYRTSQAYTSDKADPFQNSKSALQILIMNFKNKGGEIGASSGASVLCRIVDKTAPTPVNPSQPGSPTPSPDAAGSLELSLLSVIGTVLISIFTLLY